MRLRARKANRIDFIEVDSSGSEERNYRWRFIPIYFLSLGLIVFLLFNLFNLQIIEGSQNLLLATRINQARSTVVPPRGLIMDAKGRKLAYNIPAYSLNLNPSQIKSEAEEELIGKIAEIIKGNPDELFETYRKKVYNEEGKKLQLTRLTLKADLSFEQQLALVASLESLPGASVSVEAIREYDDAQYFAHILGYVGEPTQRDIENGIYSESIIGKTGVEQYYDEYLRGIEGVQIKEKGILDERERVYTPQEAKYGDNLYLTIDSRWQKKLTDLMNEQSDEVDAFASAGVIMNSSTGEILASVSLPSYDNNLFAKGISYKDYSQLINNPKTPLLNRVVGLQLPPGSIYKIIAAAAGLQEGVINESTKFLSDRCKELPGKIFFCEADSGYLGYVNVKDALSKSSNIFFCEVALKINTDRKGIRTLIDYAQRFGMGQTTGIDLPGEQTGSVPSPGLKQKLLKEPWYTGDECNMVIGQGLVTTTPIQMTVAMAAIANGGNIVKPHVLGKVENQLGKLVFENKTDLVKKLDIDQSVINIIKSALRRTAIEGTAKDLNGVPGNPIAKTGSSDAGEYIQGKYYVGSHSWVMGCFDYQGNNYCYTVMQQWGGRGYKTVPIMKKFINCVYADFADKCEVK